MKELPINTPIADNCIDFQNFCKNVLKVPALVSNTHVSAVSANNWSFKNLLTSQDVYKKFYYNVVCVKDCSV